MSLAVKAALVEWVGKMTAKEDDRPATVYQLNLVTADVAEVLESLTRHILEACGCDDTPTTSHTDTFVRLIDDEEEGILRIKPGQHRTVSVGDTLDISG